MRISINLRGHLLDYSSSYVAGHPIIPILKTPLVEAEAAQQHSARELHKREAPHLAVVREAGIPASPAFQMPFINEDS